MRRWYRVLKDYLLFHVAGADTFYHEEGNDIFWKPGEFSGQQFSDRTIAAPGAVSEAVINITAAASTRIAIYAGGIPA